MPPRNRWEKMRRHPLIHGRPVRRFAIPPDCATVESVPGVATLLHRLRGLGDVRDITAELGPMRDTVTFRWRR